jgi:hypothetical protein
LTGSSNPGFKRMLEKPLAEARAVERGDTLSLVGKLRP